MAESSTKEDLRLSYSKFNNPLRTISGISVLSASWLFGICLIYYLHRFYVLKGEMIFIKRRGNLVVAYTLCAIFILFIGYPSGYILHWGFDRVSTNNHSSSYIALEIVHIIDIFIYYLYGMLILLRYWMIYYDMQFSNGCLNLEWKQCISKSANALRKEKRYIQHRNTFGNQSFMVKIAVITSVCCAVIGITLHASYTLFDLLSVDRMPLFSSILSLVMIIILIIIWQNMPYFEDKIYLYKEFRIIAFFWILGVCVYACMEVIADHIFHDKYVVLSALGHFSAIFVCFIVPFMSTFGVLKYIKIQHGSNVCTETQGLIDIFSNEKALCLFMQHLIKEFSIECLLSVIEFEQFKSEAMKAFNIELEDEIDECIVFSNNVPKSDIVYEGNDGNDILLMYKIKAYKLYKKYIENGSDFEINISTGTRSKLFCFMKDHQQWINEQDCISKWDLIKIFDKCTREMYLLLTYSQRRMQWKDTHSVEYSA